MCQRRRFIKQNSAKSPSLFNDDGDDEEESVDDGDFGLLRIGQNRPHLDEHWCLGEDDGDAPSAGPDGPCKERKI